MKKLIFIASILFSAYSFAQESHGDRTVNYTIELDMLKSETQELSIERSLKDLKGVNSCDVDALNYTLKVSVFEPKENNTSIEIDDIKIILAENNVEIKNYTQKVILK